MAQLIVNSKLYTYRIDVDDEDYQRLSTYNWYIVDKHVRTVIDNKWFDMARLVLNDFESPIIDHKDRNAYNNCKSNLRPCTKSQNQANVGLLESNTTGFKGVHYRKNRGHWYAKIRINYKDLYLGSFKTKEQAAGAYDRAAKQFFGEFACTNESLRVIQ